MLLLLLLLVYPWRPPADVYVSYSYGAMEMPTGDGRGDDMPCLQHACWHRSARMHAYVAQPTADMQQPTEQ